MLQVNATSMSLYAAKVVAVVLLCDKNRAIECQGCKGRASVACHCCESAGAGWVLLRVDTTPDLLAPTVRQMGAAVAELVVCGVARRGKCVVREGAG